MAAPKIPPHIARELQRHVAKSTRITAAPTPSSSAAGESSSGNKVLIGCLSFLGFSISIPFIAMQWVGISLTDKEDPLTAAQVRRGAFLNSGSRDAGKDPNWNKGQYKKDKEYQELFKKDNPDKFEHGEEYYQRR
eukprot:CAMPEP_0119014136 /NCGR_PEP_ID=MMETSP1176-20130426/9374_1 /TAXON_ID=265551 /ORGANISM="Synedropsis recta cf, Strain CCMP1620" /LENGTH=134 /DNA_ID=CAMNT_0006967277 /DNA_START=21 /DNA_END=425 /DNA_ORIENTATION=-